MKSQNQPTRLPIVIVAGFLGSGKTTFIRDLLPHLIAGNISPYVILNDFRNAAIDAHSLHGLGAEIKVLASGCVCCDDASSLIRAIQSVPRSEKTLILLEANGATDPYRLIETISLTPSLQDIVGKILQITVINESRWGKRWLSEDKMTERAQVRTASALMLNRGDKASEKHRLRVATELAELNCHASILDQDAIVKILLEKELRENLPNPDTTDAMEHRHMHVAVQVQPPMMTEDILRKWLIHLPREIIRIKGLARISETEMAYFQRTDDIYEVPRIVRTIPQTGMEPAAVFIGPGVSESMIRNSFGAYAPEKGNFLKFLE